jgi:undecaprenyl-diphosphatase
VIPATNRAGGVSTATSLPDHLVGLLVVIVWVGLVFALTAIGLAVLVAVIERGDPSHAPLGQTASDAGTAMTRPSRWTGSRIGWIPVVTGGVVFGATTIDLLAGGPLRRWDHSVIPAVVPTVAVKDPAWQALADIGGSAFLAFVLVAALSIHLMNRRGRSPAALAAGWVVLIAATTWLAKTVIGRTPPWSRVDLVHAGGMSYPSGHSTSAAAFLLIAATLATKPGSRPGRIAAWAVPVLAAAVAIATVHLHYHWPSDAISGWALGLALGAIARRTIRRSTRGHFRER